MEHQHNNPNDITTEKIAFVEKAIKTGENLHQRAVTQAEMYKESIKKMNEKLKELGTSEENAEADLKAMDQEIAKQFKDIENGIDFNLLLEYKLITEDELKRFGLFPLPQKPIPVDQTAESDLESDENMPAKNDDDF